MYHEFTTHNIPQGDFTELTLSISNFTENSIFRNFNGFDGDGATISIRVTEGAFTDSNGNTNNKTEFLNAFFLPG
jgi:hypothetical protein